MITLYTTHCPKCKIVEMKLKSKSIEYEECDNIEIMLQKGFKQAPMLDVDGQLFDFSAAINYINNK